MYLMHFKYFAGCMDFNDFCDFADFHDFKEFEHLKDCNDCKGFIIVFFMIVMNLLIL